MKAWYHTGSEDSATANIEPLVDFFAAQGDPANALKAEPAISIMGEVAKYAVLSGFRKPLTLFSIIDMLREDY